MTSASDIEHAPVTWPSASDYLPNRKRGADNVPPSDGAEIPVCRRKVPSRHGYPVHFTTYRGLSTAAAPRSLALKRTTTSWVNSASLPGGAWVTVIGQFSM